jgi:hypothetical protein
VAAGFAAQSEVIVFPSYFADFLDPQVVCPLQEILLLCLLAVLAGGGNLRRYRAVRPEEDRGDGNKKRISRRGGGNGDVDTPR